MDTSTTFALSVTAGLAALLAVDLLVAAVRSRHVLARRLDPPLRVVVGSTLCAAILFGGLRPASAVTPPPSARLVEVAPGIGPSAAPASAMVGSSSHTVERGESLWRIARSVLERRGLPATGHDVAAYWPIIYAANRDLVGADPDLIHPGQVLVLPEPPLETGATDGT